MKNLLTVTAIAAGVMMASCSKSDSPVNTVQSSTVNNLIADTIVGLAPTGQPFGTGKFTFFSLETNQVIASSDSATNKWDLAFRGTTILTNAGTSGPGLGGAFVFVGTFESLATIPADSTFKVDASPVYAITTGSGKGWYSYDGASNLITAIPGRVLVIRTASGKYAKVEIQNYYKGGVTPDASASDAEKLSKQRYYKFRFSYQSNGTKTF